MCWSAVWCTAASYSLLSRASQQMQASPTKIQHKYVDGTRLNVELHRANWSFLFSGNPLLTISPQRMWRHQRGHVHQSIQCNPLVTIRPCSHWRQFYPTREPLANGTRRVARVHTASTVSGSSGTLRPHQEVFAVDANGTRRVGAAVWMLEWSRRVRQRRAICECLQADLFLSTPLICNAANGGGW